MLIHPSLYESYGYPPLEAMASGIPVAATKTGKMAGPLGEFVNLFAQEDMEGLSAIMVSFSNQPEPFIQLANQAQEVLRRTIDNRNQTSLWLEIISGILN